MANKDAIVRGPIVIPNCVWIGFQFTQVNAKTCFVTAHAIVGGGFSASAAVAEAIRASIAGSAAWTAWKAYMPTASNFLNVYMRDLRQANMPLVNGTATANAGTDATGALPPGDAACITLRTANAGRSGRGRMYLPCLGKAAVDANGILVAGAVTAAGNFATQLDTSCTASSAPLALGLVARNAYTSDKGTPHPQRGATAVDITSFTMRNNIVDHQRRRAGRS